MSAPDFVATTTDIKIRCERVAVSLMAIAQQTDPIFADPRGAFLAIVLAPRDQ